MANLRNDAVGLVFEPAVADDNCSTVDLVSSIRQRPSQMSGVGSLLIDKVVLTVESQGLGSTSIDSVYCGFGFLEHDQGRSGHDLVTVPERPASGEAVNEIELEYFASNSR